MFVWTGSHGDKYKYELHSGLWKKVRMQLQRLIIEEDERHSSYNSM